MANQSFLYSINKIPTKENRKEVNKVELSISNWYIPFSFLVLISGNPQPIGSLIWETESKTAVIADYQESFKNLVSLFNLITSKRMLYSKIYLDSVVKTIEFLNLEKTKQKYILLEPGEIFGLRDEVGEKEVFKIIYRSEQFVTALKNNNLEKINAIAWEQALSTQLNLFGIINWSDPLYSFKPYFFFGMSVERNIKRYYIDTCTKIAVNEVLLSKSTKANFEEFKNRINKFGNYRFNVQWLINIIRENLDSTGEFYSQDIPDLYAQAAVCKYVLTQKNPSESLQQLTNDTNLSQAILTALDEIATELGGPEMSREEYKNAAQVILEKINK